MTMDVWQWISVVSLAVGAVALLAAVFPEEARDFVAGLLSKVHLKRGRMYGRWRDAFTMPPDSSVAPGGGSFDVVHFGRKLTGKAVDPAGAKIRCRATFKQDIITGTWFDVRHGDSSYYGAFQLKLDPDGRTARGRWIGFGKSNAVLTGEMTWTKEQQ
ncbi:MAG: hypothetical protein K2X32_12065 [Phycisphaerales bacterium]|nr:hypothetical protein [Phycisphaerales bacterium]